MLMEGPTVICKGEFKVKTTHPLSSWLIITMGLHFRSTCQLLKSCRCLCVLDWFFTFVDCLLLEACWASWSLFLWFYLCVKFILWLKLVDAKFSHDLILIYFVIDHLFLWSLSSLIILWLQQNGVMVTRIVWWDCPNTKRWSYNWSCVWCFNL